RPGAARPATSRPATSCPGAAVVGVAAPGPPGPCAARPCAARPCATHPRVVAPGPPRERRRAPPLRVPRRAGHVDLTLQHRAAVAVDQVKGPTCGIDGAETRAGHEGLRRRPFAAQPAQDLPND